MDENKIRKQAKQILDKFARALDKVKDKDVDSYIDGGEFERKEGPGKESVEGFKQRFLKNAPEYNDDFIIAEKGDWK